MDNACELNNFIFSPLQVGPESPLHKQDTENPEKEDIYRLGVILVEVITGKPMNSQSEVDDLKFQVKQQSSSMS